MKRLTKSFQPIGKSSHWVQYALFRNGINYDKNVEGNTVYKIINVRNISSSTLFLDESNFDMICLPQRTR